MRTPNDVKRLVLDTFGHANYLLADDDDLLDIIYDNGHKQVRIFIEWDGWDIYTTLHGMLWSGDLQNDPPSDVIDKVLSYMTTFK